jgi:GT2 family glycosyltransferase
MDLSIVVLAFNAERHIDACMKSCLDTCSALGLRYEILVVENGSSDRTRALLDAHAQRSPGIVPIYSPTNLGTTRSRNLAWAQAKGRHVLVLDVDATISADALGKLINVLDASPSIGMAVPQLRYPDGRFQVSADRIPSLTHKLRRLLFLRDMEKVAVAPSDVTPVQTAISAAWLLKRSTIDTVGPLDEKIFYSPEDLDYCVRVWRAGLAIVYVPQAVATHDAQELSRSKKLNGFFARHASGLLYFFRKYGCGLSTASLERELRRANPQFP